MAELTWDSIEMPILEAAVAGERSHRDVPKEIAGLDIDPDERMRATIALIEAGYLRGKVIGAWGSTARVVVQGVTERARRATGQWPSEDPFASLLQFLDERIANTEDPEAKSSLVRLREALFGVGESVGGGLLLAWAKQRLHLP